MEAKKILRYSMQLAYLKQLFDRNMIDENEYKKIEKQLMKDYGVVSNIAILTTENI